jgi:hypothetical protein
MKTQLVQVEAHDDLISLKDKMDWAKTPRILLVIPKRTHISLSPLELELLTRHAVSLGAQLGLVTADGQMQRAAQHAHIPVFSTSVQAQHAAWPVFEPAPHKRRRPRRDLRAGRGAGRSVSESALNQLTLRLGIFAMGVLAVLLIFLLFIPSAQIRLVPAAREQSITLPVSAAPDVATVFLSGNIPARPVIITVKGVAEVAATGTLLLPDQPARGLVRFRNLTANPVTIPADTVVRTAGPTPLRFVTLLKTTLDGGTGNSADLEVVALEPGAPGNVAAGQITAIEGNLGLLVTATNPEALSGGADVERPAPSEADRAKVRTLLVAQLQQQALADMRGILAPNDLLFPGTISLARTLDEAFTPPAGRSGETLSLYAQLEFQAYYASGADLEMLARAALDAAIPVGYAADSESLTLAAASALFSAADGSTRWQLRAGRTIRAQIDPGRVIALARGRSLADAAQNLQSSFDLADAPQVTLAPQWWPVLPVVPFRIGVTP